MEERPQLSVYWDPDRTGETRLIPNKTGVLVPTRRFHVVVENTGEDTARECRGFIDSVEGLAGGVSRPDREFAGRLPLQWACTGGQTRADIEPTRRGSPHRLQLLSVPMDSFFFQLVSPVGDESVPKLYSIGRYRVNVSVGCSNAATVSCRLVIEFSGPTQPIKIREPSGLEF